MSKKAKFLVASLVIGFLLTASATAIVVAQDEPPPLEAENTDILEKGEPRRWNKGYAEDGKCYY